MTEPDNPVAQELVGEKLGHVQHGLGEELVAVGAQGDQLDVRDELTRGYVRVMMDRMKEGAEEVSLTDLGRRA